MSNAKNAAGSGLVIENVPIGRHPIAQEAIDLLPKLNVDQSFVIPSEHLPTVISIARRISGKIFKQQIAERGFYRIGRVA